MTGHIAYSAYLVQNKFQPIHGAATRGHLNIVQLLIDVYGVDPIAKSEVSMETYVHYVHIAYCSIQACVLMYVHTYVCMYIYN